LFYETGCSRLPGVACSLRSGGLTGCRSGRDKKRGNTSEVTDANAMAVETYKYDVHGKPSIYDPSGNEVTSGVSAIGNRFLFTGRKYYRELGLYNLRNRFYMPELGRFLQPDPIGFVGDGANLYRYCANNPVNLSDPTGEYFRDPRWNADGSVTIEIPVEFGGHGYPPAAEAAYRRGVDSLSGTYNGVYVKFEVTGPTGWENAFYLTNKVDFRPGEGEKGYGDTDSGFLGWGIDQKSTVYADGGRVFGESFTAEQGASHEVLHFLGFTDAYNTQTGELFFGVDRSDILGDLPGGNLTDEEVRQILYGGGGRGGHGQGPNTWNQNNGTNGTWGNPAYQAGSLLSQLVPKKKKKG
jgi:RHS repeat-associated protein